MTIWGTTAAVLVAVAVLVVQQVESNVLHPVVVAHAVSLHPVAILLAVTTGAVVAGIIGAVLAAPLTAVAGQARLPARAVS
ncbi:MAG: AI-2E family transporter [Actinomycetota bacterium]|nr:AI-2E family transporter [Actinomycetota bacterium]